VIGLLIGILMLSLPGAASAEGLSDAVGPAPGLRTAAIYEPINPIVNPVAEREAESADYHIQLVLNESVEEYIDYFSGPGKTTFQQWLENSAPSFSLMTEIFRSENLPEELVYVAMIESGFEPGAVSRAKAVGPWQLMPTTARRYGLRSDSWVDERRDPAKSTRAAALFFRDLHNRLYSWPLVLAAYNAGFSKVHRAMRWTGSEDFWDLKDSTLLRSETKNFVPKFMAAALIARDPAAYGFRAPAARPAGFDKIAIRVSMDLSIIAYCTGSSYEMIKSLNPEITGRATPPEGGSYVLKIPKGTSKRFRTRSAAIWKAAIGDQPMEMTPASLLRRNAFDTHSVFLSDTCSPAARPAFSSDHRSSFLRAFGKNLVYNMPASFLAARNAAGADNILALCTVPSLVAGLPH